LLLLLASCSPVVPAGAVGEPSPHADLSLAHVQLSRLPPGYVAGGSLGFALQATTVDERLYRRAMGDEREVVWVARFTSRWPLTVDQLDRWNAQVAGLVADCLGDDVRLAGWQPLVVAVGDEQVGYRYTLASTDGDAHGEATIVAFSDDEDVVLTAAAGIGGLPPLDAAEMARAIAGTVP
jgi:hypothetical protein